MSHPNHSGSVVFAALVLAASLYVAPVVRAQDFDRYRPNPPVPSPAAPRVPVPRDVPVDGSPEELVSALRGVMILDHPSRVQETIPAFDGLHIDPGADLSVARSSAFAGTLQPYIGQPISIRMLNEMSRNIVTLYQRCGQPVVDVSMPPGQDITDGVVQIVITEARVGRVIFNGNCWFDDCMLLRQSWLCPGQRIRTPCLQRELIWYNQNPFRDVEMRLAAGSAAGTTDIVYDVCDRRPIRGYVGYDDGGTRVSGIERLLFGFNWGNAWGRDRQLSYQYTANANMDGALGVHSFVYQVPIVENRDIWTVFGSWADFGANIGGGLANDAEAWQMSGRYRHILSQSDDQVDQLQFGFDTKGTNSDLDFGGVTVLQQHVEVVNLTAGVSSQQKFNDGSTMYALDGFLSPGHLLGHNNSADFRRLRADTQAYYIYARGYIERLYHVDERSDFVARVTGQISNDRLLPTEQLGFGGYRSIRGYDMRTVNGDNGYIVNLEYRSKPIRRWSHGRESSITFLAFGDCGQQFNWDPQPNEQHEEFLAGVGVGVRCQVDSSFTLRVDYGHPLTDIAGLRDNHSGRLHIGGIVAF